MMQFIHSHKLGTAHAIWSYCYICIPRYNSQAQRPRVWITVKIASAQLYILYASNNVCMHAYAYRYCTPSYK